MSTPSPIEAQQTQAFFRALGSEQRFAPGSAIFTEERRPKAASAGAQMYLLVSGQVALTRNKRPVELVMPDEIFGATSVLCDSGRVTTATVMKESVVIGLDTGQFARGLQQQPEFVLTMMQLLGARMQSGFARAAKLNLPELPPAQNAGALSNAQISALRHALGDPQPIRMDPGGKVISQGGKAMFMYVLAEGRVGIMVGERCVERVGPGGAFGEMALVSGARAADAVAESASAWYAIGRKELVQVTEASGELGVALLRSLCRRVMHVALLLSEPPTRLAALNLVRIDPSRIGGLKLFQTRTLRSFVADATAEASKLEAALAAQNDATLKAGALALKALTEKVGADRLRFYAESLELILKAGPRETLPNCIAALREELQDTAAEVAELTER